MYGTRAAPQVWNAVVKHTLSCLGLIPSTCTPSLFDHPPRDIRLIAHVDDFLITGEDCEVDWIKKELEKSVELKSRKLGLGESGWKIGDFIGRTIELSRRGIKFTGDIKHAKSLRSEWDMSSCKGVRTPVSKDNLTGVSRDVSALVSPTEATRYRRVAARVNCMSLDRLDLSYASKEASRGMASPTRGDVINMKRMLRCIKTVPSFSIYFDSQDPPSELVGYTDSDWVGCTKTRKSTSGGIVVIGKHVMHQFSSTQATIALSSGETELNA